MARRSKDANKDSQVQTVNNVIQEVGAITAVAETIEAPETHAMAESNVIQEINAMLGSLVAPKIHETSVHQEMIETSVHVAMSLEISGSNVIHVISAITAIHQIKGNHSAMTHATHRDPRRNVNRGIPAKQREYLALRLHLHSRKTSGWPNTTRVIRNQPNLIQIANR